MRTFFVCAALIAAIPAGARAQTVALTESQVVAQLGADSARARVAKGQCTIQKRQIQCQAQAGDGEEWDISMVGRFQHDTCDPGQKAVDGSGADDERHECDGIDICPADCTHASRAFLYGASGATVIRHRPSVLRRRRATRSDANVDLQNGKSAVAPTVRTTSTRASSPVTTTASIRIRPELGPSGTTIEWRRMKSEIGRAHV